MQSLIAVLISPVMAVVAAFGLFVALWGVG